MMQHRPTLFTALLFALLVSPYVSKGQEVITIAHDGKTDYRIVQSKRATEPEKFAVEELATFLGRVTGARFPVVSEASLTGADAKQIYVGWTNHAAHNGIDTVNLGEEEWVIRTIGDGLVLTGGRPARTMYAVYEFLEDQIGCHWLDRKTEVIPPKPTLDIGRLNIQAKPWFWLGYQLLVDPHQPVEPLIRTFMDGYFGAAGDAMRDYLRYLRKRIDADAQFKMLRDEPHKLAYLDLEFFQTSQKLFDEAEMQVEPDSLSVKHVAVERFTLDAALLYLWPWLERKLPAGKTLPFDREAVIQRYERGWQALVSSRYSRVYTRDKNSLNADGRLLERMVGLFRDSQLPEQFRDLPPRDVADFNWLTFSQIRPRQKFVPDDEAAGRMTATFTERKPNPKGGGGWRRARSRREPAASQAAGLWCQRREEARRPANDHGAARGHPAGR